LNAADRWREALRAWGIPEAILAKAPESPYGFPTEPFRRRAERSGSGAQTPTTSTALETLPGGGTVLDVGVGAGATSLPLAGRASEIVGVDASRSMLAAFGETASAAGVGVRTIEGEWPLVAPAAPVCDVVTCGHVLYNVQDVAPFARALDGHARHRVVVELTAEHPLAWMNDLWMRFHGIRRPTSPTAEDARAVLSDLGLDTDAQEWTPEPRPSGFERREDAIALIRRRLCLPRDADDEIADALGDRLRTVDGSWSAGPEATRLVTIWWRPGGASADS
jgi:SAM-dependent methyltransferase